MVRVWTSHAKEMVSIMKEVLEEFSYLLGKRLSNGIYTTEDSVRYTFSIALLKKANIAPHEVILEYPHPTISGAKIDTYLPSTSERAGLVVEFKYDRQIPSGKNSPKSQKAGKLFNDIFRLARFDKDDNATFWLIYLTDKEMASYLRNNGLVDFFDLDVGEVLMIDDNYISTKSATFRGVIGGPINIRIKSVWSKEIPNQHEARVYEILPIFIA